MKAMIMAAGFGTRMGEITQSIPKVLVDINGKSLLQHAVEFCCSHGFDDIIVHVRYKAALVEDEIRRLNGLGFRISVSDERELLLENGGGLYKARDFFDNQPFLVYNADIVTDLDLSSLFEYHLEKNALATLAVRQRPGSRFLLIDREGVLRGWRNVDTGEEILKTVPRTELIEIGFSSVQIIDPGIFRYMKEGIYTVVDLYLELASTGRIFTQQFDDGYWFNVGSPEELEKVRAFLSKI
ncbi:MAG: nucleotidyltransferase family protein [Bacteroidales bacterium]|nr:nucleotidyltransferase family protein [Bacteroidales bacterium]